MHGVSYEYGNQNKFNDNYNNMLYTFFLFSLKVDISLPSSSLSWLLLLVLFFFTSNVNIESRFVCIHVNKIVGVVLLKQNTILHTTNTFVIILFKDSYLEWTSETGNLLLFLYLYLSLSLCVLPKDLFDVSVQFQL